MSIRLEMWYVLSISVTYMSIFFSLAAIMDLYLVLRNPFSSSEKRIKKFIVISIVLSLICACSGLAFTKSKTYWVSQTNYFFYQTIAIFNILMAVIVMVLVIFRFRKKGMNSNIKSQI